MIDIQPIPPCYDELGAGENALALLPGPGPTSTAAHVYISSLQEGSDVLIAMHEALCAAQEVALQELKLHLERRARA